MEPVRVDLWEEGEYTYPAAFGFRPNLRLYLVTFAPDDPAVTPLIGRLCHSGIDVAYVKPE